MGHRRVLFNVGRNYACSSLEVGRVGRVTSLSLGNCTVNNLTINRPDSIVCSVVRGMAPFVPGSGVHCLVNINAPTGVLGTMRHKISLFSYMVPDHGTHRKRLFADRNVVGVGGGGCRFSVQPVSRGYNYPIYRQCSETCMERLLGDRRVLSRELLIVRGL